MVESPLVVIADDFSGATEVAGRAHRFGLSVEVRTGGAAVTALAAAVTVIDTGTRDGPATAAEKSLTRLGRELARLVGPDRIFKKIDSVLRGHLATEINALQQACAFQRVWALPANPTLSRCVVDGRYLVNGRDLADTPFRHDPHFPATDSRISPRFAGVTATVCSPDVSRTEDITRALIESRPGDLIVGAADAFTAWLQHHGHHPAPLLIALEASRSWRPALVLNGSATRPEGETEAWSRLAIPIAEPGTEPDLAQSSWAIYAESGHAGALAELASRHPGTHLALTGGATAGVVLRHLGLTRFNVALEHAPGVVTLLPCDAEYGPITVKPGSYPWPAAFLELIA